MIILAMCIFSVILALLGFSKDVIFIFVLLALAVFIFRVFRWSFKKLNEEKSIHNISKVKKITEYENIYNNFYKKYKYFFDRNTESEKKEEKISVITAIKAIKIYLRFDLAPFIDINEWTLSKDNLYYNCEKVMFVTQIAKIITQAVNELEV